MPLVDHEKRPAETRCRHAQLFEATQLVDALARVGALKLIATVTGNTVSNFADDVNSSRTAF